MIPRVIVSVASFVMLYLPLCLLDRVRTDLLYSSLGQMYQQIELSDQWADGDYIPWITKVVLPAAPVGWWSYIAPVLIATGVGLRVGRRVKLPGAVALLIAAFVLSVAITASIVPYVKILQPMGLPLKGAPGAREGSDQAT